MSIAKTYTFKKVIVERNAVTASSTKEAWEKFSNKEFTECLDRPVSNTTIESCEDDLGVFLEINAV